MARSDSHQEIIGSNNRMPRGDVLDGTSARTRPQSYDDIMLRRKNKGDKSKRVSSSSGAEDSELAQDNMVWASDILETQPQINDNFKPVDEDKNSNDSKNIIAGRKVDSDASRKNEDLVQDTDGRSLYPDAKSKDKGERNVRHNRVSEEKIGGRSHATRRKYELLSVHTDIRHDKRKDNESYKPDRVSKRSRVKSEIVKTQPHNEKRQVYRKRKTDEQIGSDSDNECKKRSMRDVKQADKLTARGREKSVKEKKNKYHPKEDKSRGRNNVKKNDSERKESESLQTYVGESRSRRRRSRSRGCEKDKGKRSLSQSPTASKHTSKDKRDLPELSDLSSKDASGKEHFNADSKRISGNRSNSQYTHNTNNSSGLGGYSPRKRKTDAAAKTPSPTCRTPERRSAGWDLQPVEKENVMTTSTISILNTMSQNSSLNIKEYPIITNVAPTLVNPIGISLHTLSSQMHAIESIQLTQATRPKRRLYVENLPVSASEKDLIECTNKLLLSSGVNYVQGTQPCISCIIHKEKNQALLEFLTPEDASAALSLDGMSFSGSKLKLRRPKDYTDVTTGLSDKSVGVVDSISDTVEDSPNKIFIGGISKFVSSSMLLEIARAFGPVKSFHFEFITDTNEPCAFLEYVDHLVTSKACAGLNGMRLGGHALTAVLATPEPVLENVGKPPTYVIPDQAKPLIQKPTAILKLKNVLDPECLISTSESEVEEILEDIRMECSRFGIVRSVNVAKKTNTLSTMEANEVTIEDACTDAYNSHIANMSHGIEQLKDICKARLVGESLSDEIIAGNITKDEVCELSSNGEDVSVEEPPSQSNPVDSTAEFGNQQITSDSELVRNCSNAGSTSVTENKPSLEEDLKLEEHNAKPVASGEELNIEGENDTNNGEADNIIREDFDAPEEGHKKEASVDLGHIIEQGSVIVEYRRPEAACMAAHCLHGRIFYGRVVTVEYVGHERRIMS